MCVVSMIGDHYTERWQPYQTVTTWPAVTREEFDALRRDVLEMKELLRRAKRYDIDHGEPDCEIEDKVALLRKVAEAVGVDLEDLLPT